MVSERRPRESLGAVQRAADRPCDREVEQSLRVASGIVAHEAAITRPSLELLRELPLERRARRRMEDAAQRRQLMPFGNAEPAEKQRIVPENPAQHLRDERRKPGAGIILLPDDAADPRLPARGDAADHRFE
ncbi:hypothetical protein QN347_17720 [Sphingomonas sp. 10B4]|nr:hypothetical protein [Sphingomonas sp. 10B4]MEB0284341.1 hypothetical protein [Sphingomonas sp. 10B4]